MNILIINHKDFFIEIDLLNPGGVDDFENTFKTSKKRHAPEHFETAYLFTGPLRKFEIWQPASGEVEGADIYAVKHPVFFENIGYSVSIDFQPEVVSASIYSRVRNVRNMFKVKTTKGDTQFASGELKFDNEPGEFDLIIDYQLKTVSLSVLFQFTVFSSKLDTQKDHLAMVKQIEKIYPRLAVDYLRKTYHYFEVQGSGESDILWWTIFGNIFRRILWHLKVIVKDPHKALSRGKGFVRADKIKKAKGRLADKLERFEGRPDKYFEVDMILLVEDNYENQYVKYIIADILDQYKRIYKLVQKDSSNTRMDKAYRMQLEFAEEAMSHLLVHPFFKGVGKLKDRKRFSPVLAKRVGYAGLIKDWETLKMGFELQEGLYEIELKNIAYLYQLWCFFAMTEMIEKITGVKPDVKKMPTIKSNTFRLSPDKDMHSKLVFECADGINIELYQELRYTNNFDADDAGTFDGSKCPDIILRIGRRDQPRNLYLTYLFDAKYRLIESTRYSEIEKMDEPLPEDLRQMRDYKESIYRKEEDGADNEHSKEVMGGYVLFPGICNAELHGRYYREIIFKSHIGGFPFLPGDEAGSALLGKHLRYIITEDTARQLDKMQPQKGKAYKVSDAFVFVDFVPAMDAALYNDLVEGEAVIYAGRKFDSAVITGRVRYFAPYIERRGITCFYEIEYSDMMPRRKAHSPGHPLFLDEGRKCMVLKLKRKEMLDDYVRIKGMASNRRYTQIKHLYNPKDGFISTVPEKDVRRPGRDKEQSGS
ncbi:DUF2357 domain-containing protein [Chitinophaga ginsengisoli]|uniref:DUF2357 domain-containing protein n=1 Tax=Chitinophaga ginsengisoli TaxID=363837 RepID=A0A2P8FZC6_9BACT|nr:DUF2357 domain-containing protein [Chitinophaga ginsengisoli]PSL27068.1 hypothetical protein CLV42_110222 [Chitinophaga ginsengisoli]